jgi:glycosyltransferase involved in cell wall biosynthesis
MIVVIFTHRSPFGAVPEFVEDEIPFWDEAGRLLVISLAKDAEQSRALAANAEAYAVSAVSSRSQRLAFILAGCLRTGVIREVARFVARGPRGMAARFLSLALAVQGVARYYRGAARILARQGISPADNVLLYSYTAGSGTYAALLLKRRYFRDRAVVVTRAHGSDLYEYAQAGHYIPFLQTLLPQCDRVLPISEHGAEYLRKHWHCEAGKVEVARLGIADHFSGKYPCRCEQFHLLSCSYVTPVKRVLRIAEALAGLDRVNLRWTHIGGGPGLADLRSRCQKLLDGKNGVTYDLRGDVPHADVVEFFRTENTNLLVNASSSEGVPVTMMEAHCSGIPVLGPAIGGVGDIVRDGVTGRLLSPDAPVAELTDAILSFIRMEASAYGQMCKDARQRWGERYSASVNYPAIVESLGRLVQCRNHAGAAL